MLWSLGQSLKFTFGAFTAFALATLVIALDGPTWLVWGAVVALLALWAMLVFEPSSTQSCHQNSWSTSRRY